MRIVLISTPIGFLGSGKGGGVELTLNSLVSGLISLGPVSYTHLTLPTIYSV